MKQFPYSKFLVMALVAVSAAQFVSAQDSTGKKKMIDITSSFKPVLREAVKINFNAASPAIDSSRPRLNYTIPQQNLLLGYLPAPLKPVALQIDSVNAWKYSNYIKVGVGSVHIPYAQAGFSFGDGQHSFFNAFAKGYTSKGKLPFQKNNYTAVSLAGTVRTATNLEWIGGVGFKSEDYFFYGFQPTTLTFTKDYLRQRFQTFGGRIGLRNLEATEFGLTYNPNLKIDVFSNNNFIGKSTETNSVLNLPLTKTFGDEFAFDLGLTADLTNLKTAATNSSIQNNLYFVSPAVRYKNDNLNLTAGVTPAWSNKLFHLLPNIMADIVTNDKSFTLQLGWIGYYDKGSYQRFAGINPWVVAPASLLSTRAQELYGGIKGSLLDHISYSVKASAVQYRDLATFVNDSIDGKTFRTAYASSAQAVRLHGELGWTQGEDLNWNNSITITRYQNVEGQMAAWGLTPLELSSSVRWQLFKDFFLKGDLYGFAGAPYQSKVSPTVYKQVTGQSGFDFSAGVEFKVTKALNLWLQMNNIFNNRYERWNQYQVYGFNILGGIVFNFDQK